MGILLKTRCLQKVGLTFMPPVLQRNETRTDWFEEISQQLDDLRQEAHEFYEEGDVIPSDRSFELVKKAISDLRQLADFPKNLPSAHVWIGPEGQIGITWKGQNSSLDLIFGTTFTARFCEGTRQSIVPVPEVARAIASFAA